MNDPRSYLRMVRRHYRRERLAHPVPRALRLAVEAGVVEVLCGVFTDHDFTWADKHRVGPCAYCHALPIRGAA